MDILHLFHLDTECNIYNIAKFRNELLVATQDCKIYCLSYNKFKPCLREIEFAYIPAGAKINSISSLGNNVIGILHSKNDHNYFNVYSSHAESDLEQLAQGCQTLRLKFIPYHLMGTETLDNLPSWLLSGSDNRIHIYVEDKMSGSFDEKAIEYHLPELGKVYECPILWIDLMKEEDMRLVALGFENGSTILYHSRRTNSENRYELVQSLKFDEYTTIIPCVRLFKRDISKSQTDLLIVSSTHPCLVFGDITNNGLSKRQILPNSQRLDCNTTATIGDIDADGHNEILIGNFGKELMIYHCNEQDSSYRLDDIQKFNHSVFSLDLMDVTGDTLNEVIVLLTNGILVLQASVKSALKLLEHRVQSMKEKLARQAN